MLGRNLPRCRLFRFVPYLSALHEHLEHNQDLHVFSRYLACFREVLLAFQFITACSLLINGDDFSWTQSVPALRCAENKVHVKVKCTLVQALRLCTGRTAHRRIRGIALLFFNHGTRRG